MKDNPSIRKHQSGDRFNQAEKYMAARGEYVWKNDLRNHLDLALGNPQIHNLRALQRELAPSHIQISIKNKSALYKFVDVNGKQHVIRGKKLGIYYQADALNDLFQNNLSHEFY